MSGPAGALGPDPAVERYPWAWLGFLIAGAVFVACYPVVDSVLGQDLLYGGLGVAGGIAILVGVRIHRPLRSRPWYLMAAGQLVWSAGDVVGSIQADLFGNEDFPGWPDGCYLLAYPLMAAGMLLLIRGRRPRRDVAGFLDAAIVTAGLGLLSWVLLAGPAAAEYAESPASAVVAVAYPVADIVLAGALVRLVTTPGGRTPAFWLLVVAVGLLIVADSAAAALDQLTYSSTDGIDWIWQLSYVVWGAAALHPSMYALSEPTSAESVSLSSTRLASLVAAVLVAPTVLAVQQVRGDDLDVWPVVIGSATLFLLVVGRMKVAIDAIVATDRARQKLQEDLAHQAAHDLLTGLPNRAQAMSLIRAALSRAQRSGALVGLLFVDLDGFKRVNDTLGHAAGDEVLRIVADRMRSKVRAGDVVARLGGDEFVVLLEPLDERASAVAIADRLVAAVSEPIHLRGRRPRLGASVGVALNGDSATDAEALLHEADVAVYRAKAAGRGRTEVFDEALRVELDTRAGLEEAIAAAVRHDQLTVHYQPIVSLDTDTVTGFEALVRWQRPGHGLLGPADFIPIAELSDLICEVDRWVLHAAARQLVEWSSHPGAERLTVAVNVSARHVARSRFVDDVRSALTATGLAPRRLVVELTETALVDDPLGLTNLADLRTMGVWVSLDDFGAGYSSVARLERLPVDTVKIDRHFLDPSQPSAARLLPLVVQSAHAFDLSVVAEGVETAEQLKLVRGLRCDAAQGYLFGAPVAAAEIDPRGAQTEAMTAGTPAAGTGAAQT